MDNKKWGLSIKEAESLTGVGERTIRKAIKRGELAATMIGNRIVISAASLKEKIDTGTLIED